MARQFGCIALVHAQHSINDCTQNDGNHDQGVSRVGCLESRSSLKEDLLSLMVNPLFAFKEETGHPMVHYNLSPPLGFRFSDMTSSDQAKLTVSTIRKTINSFMLSQFIERGLAFARQTLRNQVVLRFLAGDALECCHSLVIYPRPFSRCMFTLEPIVLIDPPLAFDVIETSNLMDHLGLINILVHCTPLLAKTQHSVLYTEILAGSTHTNPLVILDSLLMGDAVLVTTLLGVAPMQLLGTWQIQNENNARSLDPSFDMSPSGRFTWKLLHQDTFVFDVDCKHMSQVLAQFYTQMFKRLDLSSLLSVVTSKNKKAIRRMGIFEYTGLSFSLAMQRVFACLKPADRKTVGILLNEQICFKSVKVKRSGSS